MRALLGFLVWLAVATSAAALANEQPPIYLRGYYRLYNTYSIWRHSDHTPWYVVNDAPWADPRLVKWGYVPVMHDAERYYCMIDHEPPTGSRIPEWTFMCGDPATMQLLYNRNRPPVGLLYGGPH
jgi:hypothetical protein